ncbi:hypothetical protein [Mucilaginibacter ginkgonis]|uniref:Uncharacterized protein n=1 Tax=Mucilaginibacter ginkgonis TaxID=2682091 RepID=A0A6I4I5B5_9SPHI|nr:hypothetical protein [Mucilaginibacter ginkgonis]QQL48357.1 hypothetical protein GO620_009135 [Mucilaginibacter ginkgonis]
MIGLFVVIIAVIVIWIRHNRNTTTGYDGKGNRVIVKPNGAEKKNNTGK